MSRWWGYWLRGNQGRFDSANKKKYYMNKMYSKGRGNSYSRTAKRLARLEKKIKASELKTHDVTVDQSVDMTGSVLHLTGIAQGDQSLNREGLKINLTKLYGNIQVYGNETDTNDQLIRVMIVNDKDCDGALPVISDILESVHTYSLKKHEERHRYRIMFDKTFTLPLAEGGGRKYKYLKVSTKLPKKGLTIFYDGTGSAIADANSNNLFLVLLAADNGTNHPYITSRWRMRFYG